MIEATYLIEKRVVVDGVESWTIVARASTHVDMTRSFGDAIASGIRRGEVRVVQEVYPGDPSGDDTEPKCIFMGRDKYTSAVLRLWAAMQRLLPDGDVSSAKTVDMAAARMEEWRRRHGLEICIGSELVEMLNGSTRP